MKNIWSLNARRAGKMAKCNALFGALWALCPDFTLFELCSFIKSYLPSTAYPPSLDETIQAIIDAGIAMRSIKAKVEQFNETNGDDIP